MKPEKKNSTLFYIWQTEVRCQGRIKSWRGQELSNQDCFLASPDLFQGVDLIIPGIMHV